MHKARDSPKPICSTTMELGTSIQHSGPVVDIPTEYILMVVMEANPVEDIGVVEGKTGQMDLYPSGRSCSTTPSPQRMSIGTTDPRAAINGGPK